MRRKRKATPYDYHGHYDMGGLAQSLGRFRRAVAEYKKEIQLTDYYKAHYNLGIIHEGRRQYEWALREYKAAARLHPALAEAHNNLGCVYRRLGQDEKARRADQVAKDRRMAENRRSAHPAHGGGGMMIVRTAVAVVLALGLLAAPPTIDAQQAGKVYRVGYLNPGGASLAPIRLEPLRRGLRDLGYIEGRNLLIEARWAEGRLGDLPELAAELLKSKVDVIVTAAAPAARAARDATKIVPIVMVDPGDPVGSGLVASLAKPGGNMTGLSSATPDIVGKQVQVLREAIPSVSNLAFLSNPAVPAGAIALKEVETAARSIGASVQVVGVRDPAEFEAALAGIVKDRAAIIVFPDPLTFTHRRRLMELALQHRFAVVSGSREFVEAGGLIAYGPSFADMFRRAAVYVDKILRGTKAADLPVEQPTTFELVINMKTAKALGLTIPPSLLLRADQVIE